jgi:hypothetical protein
MASSSIDMKSFPFLLEDFGCRLESAAAVRAQPDLCVVYAAAAYHADSYA